MAAPYIVKLASVFNSNVESLFLFYECIDSSRPSFWKIEYPSNVRILKDVKFKKIRRYYSRALIEIVKDYKPTVCIINGLTIPSNFLLYIFCKRNNIKTVLLSEYLRDKKSEPRRSGFYVNFLKLLYKNDFDLVFAIEKIAEEYFVDTFGFKNLYRTNYPVDIDLYLEHPLKRESDNGVFNLIFTHRLIETYDPLKAIDVIHELSKSKKNFHVYFNAHGPLRNLVNEKIEALNLSKFISFLDNINTWKDLSDIYKISDISFSTAFKANGCLSLLECHASGVVVVCTKGITNNSKHIVKYSCGVVCECNIHDITKSIIQYMDNSILLEAHQIAARESVLKLSVLETSKRWIQKLGQLHEQ